MLILDAVLRPEELRKVSAIIADGAFVDGAATAGGRARRVKHNEQFNKSGEAGQQLDWMVRDALMRDPAFRQYALPKRIAPVLFSRYTEGMAYGRHVDDAIMHPDRSDFRTDLSVTIFLNDASDYDGGELLIDGSVAEEAVKLPRGAAVVYPATSLHRVGEVTRGVRLAAVTWVQSYVRDAGKRDVLSDIAAARDWLTAQPDGAVTEAADRACRAYTNLLRRWSEF